MEKLNFDIEKYQSLTPDEKVRFFVNAIFDLAILDKEIKSDIVDEEIEELYFNTIKKLRIVDGLVEESDKIKVSVIFNSLNFRVQHEFGYHIYKRKLGYSVFIEFKKFIKDRISKETPEAKKQKRLTAPVIIAMLKELGVFGKFVQKGYNRESIIDTLHQIIGVNKTNIAKYYDSMIKENKVDFTEKHQNDAKDFLNSKGL